MSTAGLLFRNGPWVDISDYNDIVKIFRSMDYSSLSLISGGDCWNVHISNDEILTRVEEEEDWEDVSGTVILYFHWNENYYPIQYKIPGIEKPLAYFLYIEELSGRGLVVLEFLHRYFERFPTDVFWEGGKYYYTKKDIEKLHSKKEPYEFWMYEDPATF